MTAYAVRRAWVAGLVLASVILALESYPGFGPARREFRDGFGPEGAADGRSALLLQQIDASAFGNGVRVPRGTDSPSSQAVREEFLAPGQWLLSLAIPEVELNDPARGILANREARGRDWERVGWASLYFGEELVFTTRMGVRVHGGDGRRSGREAFRLIFRPQYGLPHLPSGGPLPTARLPPNRFVVRQSQQMSHSQPMAFEISTRIGALAPAGVPVRFVFNGSLRSHAYELTEYVDRAGWGRSYLGHDDFRFYRSRAGSQLPSDETAYSEVRDFLNSTPPPLRMEDVKGRIDLDNFVRNLFTLMYCGTGDSLQGAAVLNLRSGQPRWFWVHWDLDLSFGFPHESWRRPSIRNYVSFQPGPTDDIRLVIFQRLLREDLQFKRYFTTTASETINHLLTRAYLRGLVRKYAQLSVNRVPFVGFDLEAFFERRGDVVLDAIADAIDEPRPHTVRVHAPVGVRLRVDGQEHGHEYTGRYFHGQIISVEVVGGEETQSRRPWKIDDASVWGQALVFYVEDDVEIQAERN